MSNTLLVSPVIVCHAGAEQRKRDRVIPAFLRAWAATSQSLLGGRGVRFGCTVAANLIGTNGRIVFRLAGGGLFSVRTDDCYWLNYLFLTQSYETDLDHFLSRALTARDSFLDCGANLGLWSIAMARVIGDKTRVVAVEASSCTFAQLEQNWEANDRSFMIVHRAVGTTSEEQVSFFSSVDDHASATMVEGLSPDDAKVEFVTTVSLLDLVDEQLSLQAANDALIFVKLDIEGMERQIFSTLRPTEHGSLLIMFEDHGNEINHVAAFVLEQGFQVAFLADDGTLEPIRTQSLYRLDELKTNPARGYNLLAFAPVGSAASRLAALFDLEIG